MITFPRPEDTAYYVGVARNLVDGRGLVSDAIWSYGTPPLAFPRPAFEVWLPLPTFLAALPMAILGTTFAAAQWSSIFVGGLVAVLAWRLAADVAAERGLPAGPGADPGARDGALGGRLPAPGPPLGPARFHDAVRGPRPARRACSRRASCATPAAPGSRDPRVLALGRPAGPRRAHPERGDLAGARLGPRGAWCGGAAGAGTAGWFRLVAGAAVPAMLVFAPWAVRDWIEFGSPFPGQALANALSLDGRDIFAWQETPTLGRYLDAGLGTLVGLRWTGFLHNL